MTGEYLGETKFPYKQFSPEFNLTLGLTRKVIPSPWYRRGRGVMEPLPRVFDMLQYFKNILPSVESL